MSNQLPSGDTSLLTEVHATSSGLKVLATTTAIQDLEVARRSMGGHGYSAFSGLGRIYADCVPSATCVVILCQLWHTDKFRLKRYEGDNYVLDEQVVRAALKSHKICYQLKTLPLLYSLRHLTTFVSLLMGRIECRRSPMRGGKTLPPRFSCSNGVLPWSSKI